MKDIKNMTIKEITEICSKSEGCKGCEFAVNFFRNEPECGVQIMVNHMASDNQTFRAPCDWETELY